MRTCFVIASRAKQSQGFSILPTIAGRSHIKKMIRDYKKLKTFEEELIRKKKVNIEKNFQIVEALYHEAVDLGVIPLKDPLDGLKTDIRIAKVVNSVPKTPRKSIPKIK